jgi:hypothetical protein
MNRRNLFAFLAALPLPFLARAQDADTEQQKAQDEASRFRDQLHNAGVDTDQSWRPENSQGWRRGLATSNQCPVCGTTATPIDISHLNSTVGLELNTVGPTTTISRQTRCSKCNVVFYQDVEQPSGDN